TAMAWEVSTCKRAATLAGHAGAVTALAISSDGLRLASGSADQRLKIWEIGTWRELASLQGHDSEIAALTISQDGAHIVSGSKDQSLRLWSSQPAEPEVVSKRPERDFYAAQFSASSETLTVFYDRSDTRVFFGAATLAERSRFSHDDNSIDGQFGAIGPGGQLYAVNSASGEIRIWNVKPPKLIGRLPSDGSKVTR